MNTDTAIKKILANSRWSSIPNQFTGDACLNCFFTPSKAYPIVTIEGHKHQASRLIYFSAHPEVDREMQVRHLCHNKRCVNINHLTHGTNSDNALDDRAVGGGANQRLSEEEVEDIRGFLLMGWSQKKIADYFNVHQTTVSKIKLGTIWWSKDV